MSGQLALIPEKKPHPMATIPKIERKRLRDFQISRNISLNNALYFITYHSISSTGFGFSLILISRTLPFFNRITRSAIGVMAKLWVITITVIPVS